MVLVLLPDYVAEPLKNKRRAA